MWKMDMFSEATELNGYYVPYAIPADFYMLWTKLLGLYCRYIIAIASDNVKWRISVPLIED